jgi:hypothetical protein
MSFYTAWVISSGPGRYHDWSHVRSSLESYRNFRGAGWLGSLGKADQTILVVRARRMGTARLSTRSANMIRNAAASCVGLTHIWPAGRARGAPRRLMRATASQPTGRAPRCNRDGSTCRPTTRCGSGWMDRARSCAHPTRRSAASTPSRFPSSDRSGRSCLLSVR